MVGERELDLEGGKRALILYTLVPAGHATAKIRGMVNDNGGPVTTVNA